MSFDREALEEAVASHGLVARVVVAQIRGSTPRETGAAMLVWKDGQCGTIGGGALELAAVRGARAGQTGLSHHPLGPALGQCCGGAVTLLTEHYDAQALDALDISHDLIVRPVDGAAIEEPLSVRRVLARARAKGERPEPLLLDGWMIEPLHRPGRQLWIWGAGHVGRALVHVLAPLPDLAITWVDTASERFPGSVPAGVQVVPAADPAALVRHTPPDAEHLILTYSHALDLELCHRLLACGFAGCGLIGSATKWARFRKSLRSLGHTPETIDRITCPIGDPGMGKHPGQIAIGVAATLLHPVHRPSHRKEHRA